MAPASYYDKQRSDAQLTNTSNIERHTTMGHLIEELTNAIVKNAGRFLAIIMNGAEE